jgi:hypothetical protein
MKILLLALIIEAYIIVNLFISIDKYSKKIVNKKLEK